MKKITELILKYFLKKNIMSENFYAMYNTEIYRSGVKNLLCEYKELLSMSNLDDDMLTLKLKEIDFHINILNKVSEVKLSDK
ncbi:MAG: hypothetical protein E7E64_04995 [Clostridium celatum]|uniref:hypothetical protein n=1 Tax=Clostridium tertium TaxID=1559 RepID=UPI002903C7FA|nr:hypothetical protein [Clostridium celatum]